MTPLTTTEKIFLILQRKGASKSDLAQALGVSRQNLYNKLQRCNFTERDLRHIAEAIGCTLDITFKDKKSGDII